MLSADWIERRKTYQKEFRAVASKEIERGLESVLGSVLFLSFLYLQEPPQNKPWAW